MNQPGAQHGRLINLEAEDPQPKQHQHPPKREHAWFHEYISVLLAGNQLTNQMIKVRNWAMIALGIQACATVAGFSFYFARKATAYLIINLLSLLMLCIGADGVVYFKKWQIVCHGLIISSVLGVFFIYSLLEAFFKEDLAAGTATHMSERTTLLLMSIPFLFDFCSGCVTFYLTYLILDHEDEIRRAENGLQLDVEIKLPRGYSQDSHLCCICMANRKNMVFYPCGHQAICSECAPNFKRQSNKCPLCRTQYRDLIPVYE